MGEEYERDEYSVNILMLLGLASTDRIVRTLRSWGEGRIVGDRYSTMPQRQWISTDFDLILMYFKFSCCYANPKITIATDWSSC